MQIDSSAESTVDHSLVAKDGISLDGNNEDKVLDPIMKPTRQVVSQTQNQSHFKA